uniref:Uncharacterized protein n=1 Tax=Ditylenchus dipsaci TaxID=166011 RepID=A0A915ES96_9BILA
MECLAMPSMISHCFSIQQPHQTGSNQQADLTRRGGAEKKKKRIFGSSTASSSSTGPARQPLPIAATQTADAARGKERVYRWVADNRPLENTTQTPKSINQVARWLEMEAYRIARRLQNSRWAARWCCYPCLDYAVVLGVPFESLFFFSIVASEQASGPPTTTTERRKCGGLW